MTTDGYEKAPRSTVNRLKARARYDYDTIHNILDTSPVLHVSFGPVSPADEPFPTTLPMLGCTGLFQQAAYPEPSAPGSFPGDSSQPDLPSGPRNIYLHGWVSSRLMKLPSTDANGDTAPENTGTPVCIAATHMDGIVLALTPFHHSCNYRSAVVHGYAHIVTDPEERLYAMERITNNVLANRWANSRSPPTDAELKSTGILRIEIASASAKVRVGGPGDDRHDLKDENVIGNIWTGVVPAYLQYGEPVPSDYNKVSKVPRYLDDWIQAENRRNKEGAINAINDTQTK